MEFIKERSIKIFNEVNQTQEKEFNLVISPLKGISNTIFKVSIENPAEGLNVTSLFFKYFGKISQIVDREFENLTIKELKKYGFAPQIYETDDVTYRIEEFLEGLTPLAQEDAYEELIVEKIINNVSIYNMILDPKRYFPIMNNNEKEVFFEKLLQDSTHKNYVSFLVNKLKKLGSPTFDIFSKKMKNDLNSNPDELDALKKIEKYFSNFERYLYDVSPKKGMLLLAHNDAHYLNVMVNTDKSKLLIVDHEYGFYNFFGFDIVNYFLETSFLLDHEYHPYYQRFTHDFSYMDEDRTFNFYLKFIDHFSRVYKDKLIDYDNLDELIELAKTKEYYYRLMGISFLYILLFSVFYFDYENYRSKIGFDYFSYCIARFDGFNYVSNKLGLNLD